MGSSAGEGAAISGKVALSGTSGTSGTVDGIGPLVAADGVSSKRGTLDSIAQTGQRMLFPDLRRAAESFLWQNGH
jgi:hypothetical protein